MKEELKKLIEYCNKFGEDLVVDEMNEAYCDGAQADEIIYSTVQRLEKKEIL